MNTPVLFMIFNRPFVSNLVFEKIREQRPKRLFIAADGPRSNKPGDAGLCQQAREIVQRIDWECELKTLFQDKNLGCRNNVSQSISWFFDQVNEGIILEEDCLPDPSFFRFCSDLLEYYRHDTRVMHIAGVNFQTGIQRGSASYYFSQIPHIWGWASWKRAWKFYNVNIPSYHDVIEKRKVQLFHNQETALRFVPFFHDVYKNNIDTWDYQWTYTINANHGLAILPNTNLISNIGFAPDALHTTNLNSPFNNLQALPMKFPLVHPHEMYPDDQADLLTCLKDVSNQSYLRWIARSLLKEWIPRMIRNYKILHASRIR